MKSPIHVLHILEATEGGTKKWLENVVLGLDRNRIECTCLCAIKREPAFQETVDSLRSVGIRVIVVDMVRSVRPFKDLKAVFEISKWIRKLQPDVIHAHSSKAGMLGRVAARIRRCSPFVYTPHGFAFLGDSRFAPLIERIERYGRRGVDWLVAVSESEAEFARRIGFSSGRVVVIPNGVAFEEREVSQEGFEPSRTVVGSISNLRPQKDPNTFLEACRILWTENRNIEFELLGSGPLSQRVKERIHLFFPPGTFRLPGIVRDVRASLDEWTVSVLTSVFEGLPYALLESMAAAKPVVATRVPGIEEVVEHRITGILVPPKNPHAVAEAIRFLIRHPEWAREMGQAGRRRVLDNYTLENQLNRLMSFYETVGTGESNFP